MGELFQMYTEKMNRLRINELMQRAEGYKLNALENGDEFKGNFVLRTLIEQMEKEFNFALDCGFFSEIVMEFGHYLDSVEETLEDINNQTEGDLFANQLEHLMDIINSMPNKELIELKIWNDFMIKGITDKQELDRLAIEYSNGYLDKLLANMFVDGVINKKAFETFVNDLNKILEDDME